MVTHFRRRIVLDYVSVPVLELNEPLYRTPSSSTAPILPCSLSPGFTLSPPRLSVRHLSLPFTHPSSPSIPRNSSISSSDQGNSPPNASSDKPVQSLALSTRSAPYSTQKHQSPEGGSDCKDSDYQEDLGDADGSDYDDSDHSRDSEDEGDRLMTLLQGKRPRIDSRQAPRPKKVRMHAPKGSDGYPVGETCSLPATLPSVSVASIPYCSETSHVDPSKGCPSTPRTQCTILHKLRMYFGPHGFVCEKCGLMYPPGYLRHHITSKHPDDLDITVTGKKRKEIYDLIVTHLLTSHGVSEDVITFDLPKTLSRPIPGLTPVLSYQCPACTEPRWFVWKSLRCHYREQHKSQTLECPSKHSLHPRFIMRPYKLGNFEGRGGRHKLSDTVILLPEGWNPTDSNPPPHQEVIARDRPLNPKSAPHLVAIGWFGYLQGLEGADVSSLMKLVDLPREKDLESFLRRRATLERGLLRVDSLLVRYLQDANTFLDSCHPSVRKAITFGTKAHYRHLTRRSYVHYRTVMTKTLCMLLRVHHFSRLKNKSDLGRLGKFSVVYSEQQASATKSLYDYLVSAHGEDEDLAAHTITLVHKLLVSLVHHEIHGTRKMECPTDQSLFLISLRLSPQGSLQFQPANQLTHDCATLQYWFFTIVTHVARLEVGAKKEFSFFSNVDQDIAHEIDPPLAFEESATNQGKEVASLPSEGLPGELDAVAVLVCEADDDETEDEAETEAEAEKDAGCRSDMNILRVIHQERERWLRKTPGHDYFTPYDHFKSVWYDVAPTAFKESAKIGHVFQPDGTTIIVDAIGKKHQTNLVDIGKEVRRILLEAEALIHQCLPEGTGEMFTSFPGLSCLSDDLNDPASIFLQGENHALLKPTTDAIEQLLLRSFSSEKDMHSWLHHNDGLLSLFLVATALTCGIPPRGTQFASLQFDRCSETGASRGLFLIDGYLAIGKPAAKQPGRSREEGCLWFLPPALASCLAFYLAILRPIVIKVLIRLRKSVRYQDTHIFCRTIPRTNGTYSWSGDEVTRMMQHHTKNLNITISATLLRQLYTAFFRQYFPGLCDSGAEEDSLVDRQGQHRFYTGRQHYGQLIQNVPRSLGVDIAEARKLGAMSQLLQIVFGLRAPDRHWRPLLEAAHFLPYSKHVSHAQQAARALVLHEYGILSRGTGPPAALRARKILADHPYFRLPTHPGDEFGDAVLVRVLHAYLFGEGGPGQYDQTPPGGYPVADVAMGITLIIQAVEEWTQGDYSPVIRHLDLRADQNFNDLQRRAEKLLGDAKERWPDEWCKLCKVVRTYHPKIHKRDWGMDGLPQNESDVSDDVS